uniref:Uncharacterized protein n=1 Tax=Hyaloperonospora arabidopsidis (strain Emoy2) TaxID=559515 RepID=M4BDU7_HYAAE
MMSVASVGYVLADVAADELIRDMGSRHFGRLETPLNVQDEVLQTVMTKLRVIATLACFLFMGVAMSGWDYGGDFDFTLEYTQVMLTVGLVAVLPVLFLSFTSCESACERHSLRQSLRETWAVLNDCRLNYVLCCRFVGGICAGVSATAVNPIAFYYAGVQPLNDTVVSFIAILLVLCALKWVSSKGWDVDYRAVIVAGTVATLALDLGATMFTIWNVVRSQWLWIGLPVMEAIPSALDYTITTVILTEIADPRAHAAVSGLVMSVSFVASPMGLAVSKYIDAQFDVTNQDIMTDTTDVRTQIMGTFFIAYAMQLLALLWLLALPKNASESQSMEAGGSMSTGRAVLFLALLSVSFLFVVAVHALSVYAPTACLAIAGGKGC